MYRGIVLSELVYDQKDELIIKVLDSLKTKVSSFNFKNWFVHSTWQKVEESRIQIEVPNKFVRDWIIENYLEVIKFEFYKISGVEFEITFKVRSAAQETTQAVTQSASVAIQPEPEPVQNIQKPVISSPAKSPKRHQDLNPRYLFDDFVVGNSNQFVHAACKAVAHNPAKNYNPLFIYGGVGLGKTHLLNAIGLEILKSHPNWKIVVVSGEKFTNEVINSIRYDKTYELRNKYRVECDVLLIDDVQFIAGKERTMEEFFHTFNALYEARKQIVMTSDTLPKDIPNLAERLRSRFGWGLLADIQAPDFETRCAILRKKAEDENIDLKDDVCSALAARIKSNVRDLEGSLIRIHAFASLASVPITLDLANEVLKNIIPEFAPQISIEGIQKKVAEEFQLTVLDLKSARRHKKLALPRQIAMYLCKKHVKASFPEIGQKFGGKDHTTVLHAVRKITNAMEKDFDLHQRIEQLENHLAQAH